MIIMIDIGQVRVFHGEVVEGPLEAMAVESLTGQYASGKRRLK